MSRLTRSDIYKLPVNFNWGEGWQSWATVTEGGLGEWQAFVTPQRLAMPSPHSPIHASVSVPAGCCPTTLPTDAPKVSHVKPYALFGTNWPISIFHLKWSNINRDSSNMNLYLFQGLKVTKISINFIQIMGVSKSVFPSISYLHSYLPLYTLLPFCKLISMNIICNIQLFLIAKCCWFHDLIGSWL